MAKQNEELTSKAAVFRSRLIEWYDQHARELPWRSKPSLYKTVVSEFMLQQTQVKTVLPYFKNWIEEYPDFRGLAKASEERVLKSWEGLGYYSRARNLRKLAQQLSEMESIPTKAEDWLGFPGIGPYAAAAICSISFNDSAAVVDGNVVRILARLTGDATLYKNSGEAAKRYREIAEKLLNHERPGDHNQAMMELGATLCLKQNPQCLLCPVNAMCKGRLNGNEATLPRFEKTKYEAKQVDRVWIADKEGVLLHKIPSHAKRMKGLHEIPTADQAGIRLNGQKPILQKKRSITKYRITESFYRIDRGVLPEPLAEGCKWTRKSDLESLPLSGPHRKWIGELLEM